MKKRFIAAVVLASLALGSAPIAFASPMQPQSSTVQKPVEPSSSMRNHDCCPGVHSRLVLPVAVIPSPAEVPCEQHPCCAKQAPQSQPALPAASTRVRPASEGVPVVMAEPHRDGPTHATIGATGNNPFQPYSVRSTVLRI